MATANDLLGMGMPPALARIIGQTVASITAATSTSAAAAPQITTDAKVANVNGGTSVAAVGSIGGNSGLLNGDEVWVFNNSGAAIILWVMSATSGGATIYGGTASVAASTGVSISAAGAAFLKIVSPSTVWLSRLSV